MNNKRKIKKVKKLIKATARARASVGDITINIKNEKKQRPPRAIGSLSKPQPIVSIPSMNSLYSVPTRNPTLEAHAQILKNAINPIIKQLNLQTEAISDVQNSLMDDALRKNVQLLQSDINKPTFKSESNSANQFSPTGNLTPSTQMVSGLEQAKAYLKNNIQYMPKLKGKRGKVQDYTAEQIDKLQANRIQTLYQETKANIERLSDPEEGYVTPTYAQQLLPPEIQMKISTNKKLGRDEYLWLKELDLLDTLPQSIFKQGVQDEAKD